jgi:hypothetical protein
MRVGYVIVNVHLVYKFVFLKAKKLFHNTSKYCGSGCRIQQVWSLFYQPRLLAKPANAHALSFA